MSLSSKDNDPSNFIAFLQQKEEQLINRLKEKRDHVIAKLDYNESRLLKMFPDHILEMNVAEFLEKYEDQFDQAFVDSSLVGAIQNKKGVVEEGMNDKQGRPIVYSSPPKKEVKKRVIKKKGQ